MRGDITKRNVIWGENGSFAEGILLTGVGCTVYVCRLIKERFQVLLRRKLCILTVLASGEKAEQSLSFVCALAVGLAVCIVTVFTLCAMRQTEALSYLSFAAKLAVSLLAGYGAYRFVFFLENE